MGRILVHWLIVTIALGITAWALPGVKITSLSALLVGGVALGFVNAVVRPVLKWLTFPATLVTLGLFLFVVNGASFLLAAWLVQGFGVSNFGWAVAGAFAVSVLSWLLSWFAPSGGKD
ncbi:MAG TPA: phage holin family protein [Deltaproteobacteria bacterium]|nr:phage holin family protein [Deltaproteobacteria bacterium]